MLTKAQGALLLQIARSAIDNAFKHKTVNVPHSVRKSRAFLQKPGLFVTLLKEGQLRGSMGYPQGTYPLVDAVIRAARDAAFNDSRFKKVRKSEMPGLRIRIDVLSTFKEAGVKAINPKKNGIFVQYGPFKGLQLPEDARKFKWTPRQMVENALRKAGLAPEMWKDRNLRIYKFGTKAFEEK
ncbi:MAG TPA: AmmeMemoRadiSam system protein A [Candidatus Nanoarchaeia archaeon]|nr:AmmeMemoRadiSam system protein A [Candidatus Nanoarchaeia archaeon]